MGEAKRKRDRMSPVDRKALAMTNKLANEGQLIAGGLASYCVIEGIDLDAPEFPYIAHAYMSGAEHLFSSIMNILDPGSEPTERDLKKMDAIAAEITVWRDNVLTSYAKRMKTEGSA